MNTQQNLIKWFDTTYKKRGLKYLRPVEAYAIFPALLKVERGGKLLDIACGGGLLVKQAVHKGLEAYGIDISFVAIDLAKSTVPEAHFQVGNAEALPFVNNYFDYITCIGSLERFFHRPSALTEMQRVSTKNARICIMVRNSKTLPWLVYRKILGFRNKTAHMDARGLNDWKNLFEETGFHIVGIYPDQWPMQRLKKWVLKTSKINFEKVRKSYLPLELSNEFIFVLEKA